MVKIEQLSKVFYPNTVNEKIAIEYVDLNVNAGDFVTVVGSNGSGKSTLFNLIAGTYPVTGGKIFLDGKDVTNKAEYKRAFTIAEYFKTPQKGQLLRCRLKII